jgi:hypothetical protein
VAARSERIGFRAVSWATIAEHFRRVPGLDPMVELVEHIASAPYAAKLFGATSMHTLVIAQTSEIFDDQDIVRVEAIGSDLMIGCQEHGWRFRLDMEAATTRRVRGAEGVAALQRILEAKRWI